MNFTNRLLFAAFLAGVLGFSTTAMATPGYFALGYGAKAMGRAGAVISSPQDSITAAANPAGITRVGQRVDFGLRFFNPQREATIKTSTVGAGSAFGAPFDVEDRSRRDLFLIPNFGVTSTADNKTWFAVAMYGNGGLNTTYNRNLYDEAFAVLGAVDPTMVPEGTTTGTADTGVLGVDLAQAIITPTISYKINKNHAVGFSALLGIQRFSARGLGNFQGFTPSPPSDNLTNKGNDTATGLGVRIGWIGDVHPSLTLGVALASKIYMSEFDKYKELFAEDGDFDIPANVSAGLTFRATRKLSLSYEYQRIFYGDVNSVANAGPILGPAIPTGSGPLGADNGLGFGWEDIDVHRIAAEYQLNRRWAFRGGFSVNDQPIPSDQVLFNILAPGVIEKHATLGFTYTQGKSSEWSFALMHGFREDVKTSLSAFGLPAEIEMYQNSVEVSYTHNY